MKNCRKNRCSCLCLLKTPLCQFKQVNKTFFLKNPFNRESNNLIYTVICQGCKEEHVAETVCLRKQQISVYRKHIRQQQYQQMAIEEHLHTCGDESFISFLCSRFFKKKKKNHSKNLKIIS